jgi:hypothetical protein
MLMLCLGLGSERMLPEDFLNRIGVSLAQTLQRDDFIDAIPPACLNVGPDDRMVVSGLN